MVGSPAFGPEPVGAVLSRRGLAIEAKGKTRDILLPLDRSPALPGEKINEFRRLFAHSSFRRLVRNITTGGHPSMALEERLRPATRFAPEVASLNMGSMGFGLFPMLNRYKDWKHDWEPATLEASRDLVFKNTYKDIEGLLELLTPLGTRFEFECYDTSHLYNLAQFLDRGLVKAPLFVQTCFGILGGIGSHPDDVSHMKRTADRLFGDQYRQYQTRVRRWI